jgi:hypothetical protein
LFVKKEQKVVAATQMPQRPGHQVEVSPQETGQQSAAEHAKSDSVTAYKDKDERYGYS